MFHTVGEIDPEHLDDRATDGCAANKNRTVPLEVPGDGCTIGIVVGNG